MRLFHTLSGSSVMFDDPNLVSAAGLVPVLGLAEAAGLRALADRHLSVPTDRGANAGLKLTSLVAGMVAGADSIDDLALLRHGGMGRVFDRAYAPSTLGSFLRAFTFGHVRQLDAVASRFLTALATRAPLLPPPPPACPGPGGFVYLDIDDTIIEVHGYAKQGAGYGYTRVRGLNALIATASTVTTAPVIVAQRLRRGPAHSRRGAGPLLAEALNTVRALTTADLTSSVDATAAVLLRADSAYYARPVIHAARRAGAHVSVTVPRDKRVRAAIAAIPDHAWTPIQYPNAIFDEAGGGWVSRAEVAEIAFTAFAGRAKAEQVPGRLVVRRIPDVHADAKRAIGQDTLFDTHRFHAFFTTVPTQVLGTVAADQVHRRHAIIEQVHADLKNSALAHLPSGRYAANAAWLVAAVIAFNLTRAAATLTHAPDLTRASTATIRRKLIHVPARVATSARRVTLHLPRAWPWEAAWQALYTRVNDPPTPALS